MKTKTEPISTIEFEGKTYKVYREEPNFGELACVWSTTPKKSVFTYDEDCASVSDCVTFYRCEKV